MSEFLIVLCVAGAIVWGKHLLDRPYQDTPEEAAEHERLVQLLTPPAPAPCEYCGHQPTDSNQGRCTNCGA